MRLLTKETDYAIRAIIALAGHDDGFVPSRRIAAEDGIPLHFLRRILQQLIKAGLVASKEGVAGGVRLKRRPEAIHLTDVIKIFQGDIQLAKCMFRRRLCSNRSSCVLRKRICRIEQLVKREFEGITIADLLNDLEVGQ
jgi:Rrf2 family protein